MFSRHLAGASVIALAVIAGSCAASAETKEMWSLSGFSHPESIDLDIPHQVLYVSNIGGAPLDKDGSFETLVDLAPGSADLDLIDKGHTAIVPRMLEDTVTAYLVD